MQSTEIISCETFLWRTLFLIPRLGSVHSPVVPLVLYVRFARETIVIVTALLNTIDQRGSAEDQAKEGTQDIGKDLHMRILWLLIYVFPSCHC